MSLYATFAGNNRGSGGGSGTVTSVGLSLPVEFNVTGSPVTSSGTLTATWASETQNFVFAAPSGGSGTPSFRLLVPSDLPALDYWGLTGNSGTVAGTNYIGTNDAQDLQIKTNSILQVVYRAAGGFQASQDYIPVDGVGVNYYDLNLNLIPNVGTTTANEVGLNNAVTYDVGGIGYSHGGTITSLNNRFVHRGDGTIQNVNVLDNSADFSVSGGITQNFRGSVLEVGVNSGYTVQGYLGQLSSLSANSAFFNQIDLTNFNANIVDSALSNIYANSGGINLSGTTSVSGNAFIDAKSLTLADTASVASISATNNFVQLANSSTVNGVTGHNLNIVFQDSATNTAGTYAVNPTIIAQNNAVVNDLQMFNSNLVVKDSAQAGNLGVLNAGVTVQDAAIVSSLSCINANPQIQGTASIGNVNLASITSNVLGSAVITNLNGALINPTVQGNATVTNFSPLTVSPQVNDTATIINGVTIGNFNINTTPAIPSVTGVSINVENANVVDPFSKVAISGNGGSLGVNYNFTIPAVTTFFQTHYLGGQEVVAPGGSTSAYGFGTNLAHSIDFQDDWTADGTGLRLGFSSVGCVGSIVGTAGKTMDAWTGALAGFGNPSGAGTIDQAIMFRAAGGLPQGGSIAVTNMYGFHAGPTLSALSSPNIWGVWIGDTNADNYFAKNVVIGGITGKPTGSDALDVTGSALVSGAIKTKTSIILEDPGAGTNSITVQAPTLAADYDFTLPVDGGIAGYVLTTDGSGVTSWTATASVEPYRVNTFTLSAGDITNGYVVLSHIPTVASSTALSVIGGPMQEYGVDFVMIGANLDWNGLGLDGVLTAGDKLVVQFN